MAGNLDHHPISRRSSIVSLGFQISYSFFHYVDCTAPDRLDFSNEMARLATLVDWRTVYYRIAWWFSMIAIPLFFILFWGSLNWTTNRPGPKTHERVDTTH